MTEQELQSLVTEWDSYPADDIGNTTGFYERVLDRLRWFGYSQWDKYTPAFHHDHAAGYSTRLARWVANAKTEDGQKTLLQYALKIAFFSESDFVALYQSAFHGAITQWTIGKINTSFGDSSFDDFNKSVDEQLNRRTWYCPVTDSMNITQFYHANNITGIEHRPCFKALAEECRSKSSSEERQALPAYWATYMSCPNRQSAKSVSLERLVLLEDFVGSGNQVYNTIEWTINAIEKPVLFVPLIICPDGLKKINELENKYPKKFTVYPIISLKECDLLGPARGMLPRSDFESALEKIAADSYDAKIDAKTHYDTPFGFKGTGCSVVMHSNTPNNTLPIVHQPLKSGEWKPLFPRSSRI